MTATSLVHEPSAVVQTVLVQLGLGTLPSSGGDWPIWRETEPDRPDDGVTVQETVGHDDLRDMISGEVDGTYGFQIRVRGNDRATARAKADEIASTIASRALCYHDKAACWVTLGTHAYVLGCFVRIANPIPIGADVPGGKRQVFTINCEARIDQRS